MIYLGIDPGLRHTGICVLKEESSPLFHEVKTDSGLDVLTTLHLLRRGLIDFLWEKVTVPHSLIMTGMERQLSVGGQASSMMYAAQMTILEVLCKDMAQKVLVFPLPIQLISYVKKVHGVDPTSASTMVKAYVKMTGHQGRISQHCVDAYFLARMAKDVYEGKWRYKLPSKEIAPFPGTILHGDSL